jgi:hypothetical protein
MNKASTIKPSGVADRTRAVYDPLTVNDTLWSDTTVTWSDATYNWSILLFTNNAVPPQMLEVKTPKP